MHPIASMLPAPLLSNSTWEPSTASQSEYLSTLHHCLSELPKVRKYPLHDISLSSRNRGRRKRTLTVKRASCPANISKIHCHCQSHILKSGTTELTIRIRIQKRNSLAKIHLASACTSTTHLALFLISSHPSTISLANQLTSNAIRPLHLNHCASGSNALLI